MIRIPAVPLALLAALGAKAAAAAPPEGPPAAPTDASTDLAKKLSNPVASLISVPFQENIDFGGGADGDAVKSTLNIQPVVPLSVAKDWNLIVRTILPVVHQDGLTGVGKSQSGVGDVVQSFFLSPKTAGAGGLVWGAGPVLLYPTATSDRLGGGKWGAGPTGVVLKQAGQSTYGALANHIWSLAGPSDRSDISATFLQPFYSYTTKRATTYAINLETTYDWKGENWFVPMNLTLSQLTKLGNQPVSFSVGTRYYLESPRAGPDWGLRFAVVLLFPK